MYIPAEPVISPFLFRREKERAIGHFPYLSYSPIFFADGRSALYSILNRLNVSKGDAVLLPAYLCQSVLNVFKQFDVNLKFYRVSENLESDVGDLRSKAKDVRFVLVIHYFGFPQPMDEISRFCKDRGIFLIEDCALSLYSKSEGKYLGTSGNYGFFSFRKSLAAPDGGMAVSRENANGPAFMQDSCRKTQNNRPRNLLSLWLKYLEFQFGWTPRLFLRQVKGLRERVIDRDATRAGQPEKGIHDLSFQIFRKTDEERIVSRRRENYIYLKNRLQALTALRVIYPSLPEGVCPLCFPILTEKRDQIRKKLLKRGINLRTYWDRLPGEVSPSDYPVSFRLAREILALPVHQNLDRVHLDYLIDCLGEGIDGLAENRGKG